MKKIFVTIGIVVSGIAMSSGIAPDPALESLNIMPAVPVIKVAIVELPPPAPPATFSESDLECMAKNIYFEARNQPYKGALAVAHVVVNRKKSKRYPNTICGVVEQAVTWKGRIVRNKCQFSWMCDGKPDIATDIEAMRAARILGRVVLSGYTTDPTNGALWYHADYVKPYWARKATPETKHGVHFFYTTLASN